MGHLIDSNVLIDYVAERFKPEQLFKLDAIFDAELNVSVITKIETLRFNAPFRNKLDFYVNYFCSVLLNYSIKTS